LTILTETQYNSVVRKSHLVCFDGIRRKLTERKNCETIFSKNITIDHLAQISIVLGDYFTFPENLQKLFNEGDIKLKSTF
jgi:hypothetical protein